MWLIFVAIATRISHIVTLLVRSHRSKEEGSVTVGARATPAGQGRRGRVSFPDDLIESVHDDLQHAETDDGRAGAHPVALAPRHRRFDHRGAEGGAESGLSAGCELA